VKSRRAHSPHLPHGGTIDMRDRTNNRFGFIVDGAVARSLGLAFVPDDRFSEVRVAHTDSPWGIGVTIAERSRASVVGVDGHPDRTVETLAKYKVRQIVAVSHRVLQDSTASVVNKDSLTIGIQPHGACSRLLKATFDLAVINEFVHGVFMRDEQELSDAVLMNEGAMARTLGGCSVLVEATTFRTDEYSTESEKVLTQLLRAIPDAVSPLASCACHNAQADPSDLRAG
jgi:hypothetical protein